MKPGHILMMCFFFSITRRHSFDTMDLRTMRMKKWIISILTVSLLAGCGQKQNEEPEETETPEPVEEVKTAWVKKPGELGIDDVKDMDAFEQAIEKSGVPYSTIRRFESTGEISFLSLVKIVSALGEDDQITGLFTDVVPSSIEEVIRGNRR